MTDMDAVRLAAREAVKEMLEVLGMDVTTAASRQEVQKDFAHLRTLRITGLALVNRIMSAAAGAVGTGIIAAIWYFMTHGRT